jgi:serine/threonine-protein kinase
MNGRALNIVHRDISPQNLVISFEGVVKVVDFGIAKAEMRETHTRSGTIKGKFAYMSPEQCVANNVDRRTDVFALGVIGYELLTGRRLFKRPSPYETYQSVIECDVKPPSTIDGELDPELDPVIMGALTKDKAERYPTAEAFGDALLGYLHYRGIGSGPGDVSRFFDAYFGQEIEEHSSRMRELISGREVAVDTSVSWGSDADDDAKRDGEVDVAFNRLDGGADDQAEQRGRPGSLSLLLDDLDGGSRVGDDDEMPAERTRIESNPLERINELDRVALTKPPRRSRASKQPAAAAPGGQPDEAAAPDASAAPPSQAAHTPSQAVRSPGATSQMPPASQPVAPAGGPGSSHPAKPSPPSPPVPPPGGQGGSGLLSGMPPSGPLSAKPSPGASSGKSASGKSASGPLPGMPPSGPLQPSGRFPDLSNLPTMISAELPPEVPTETAGAPLAESVFANVPTTVAPGLGPAMGVPPPTSAFGNAPTGPAPGIPSAMSSFANAPTALAPTSHSDVATQIAAPPSAPPGHPPPAPGHSPSGNGAPPRGQPWPPSQRPHASSAPSFQQAPMPPGYPVMNAQMSEQIATGATVFPSEARGSHPSPLAGAPALPAEGRLGPAPGFDATLDSQRAANLMSPVGEQFSEHVDWGAAAASRIRAVPPWLLAILFVGTLGVALALTIVIAKLIR